MADVQQKLEVVRSGTVRPVFMSRNVIRCIETHSQYSDDLLMKILQKHRLITLITT